MPYSALVQYLLPRVNSGAYNPLTFIRLSWSTMDALDLLRVDDCGSRLRSRLYRMLHSKVYTWLVLSAVLSFLLLAFWEAPIKMRRTPFPPDQLRAITLAGCVIVLALLVDAALWVGTLGLRVITYDHKREEVVSQPNLLPLVYLLFLLAFAIDVVFVGMVSGACLDAVPMLT